MAEKRKLRSELSNTMVNEEDEVEVEKEESCKEERRDKNMMEMLALMMEKIDSQNAELNAKIDYINAKFDQQSNSMIQLNTNLQILNNKMDKSEEKHDVFKEFVLKKFDECQGETNLELQDQKERVSKLESSNLKMQGTVEKSFGIVEQKIIQLNDEIEVNKVESLNKIDTQGMNPMLYGKNITNLVKDMTDEMLKMEVKMSLKKGAAVWFSLVQEKCITFEIFTMHFEKQYWNVQAQRRTRDDLDNGKYLKNKNVSRETYVIEKYSKAQHLRHKINDMEIIAQLAEHLEQEILTEITVRGIEDFDQFVEVVRRYDNMEDKRQYDKG